MKNSRTYRILVVDDEQDLCEVLRYNFTKEGYEVEVAHSAEEALKLPIDRYDLLILDVMMEGMSGFDMARHIRESRMMPDVPIIFLTAKAAEEDTLHGFGLGADDYITKPYRLPVVMARVRAVLNRTTANGGEDTSPHAVCYEGIKLNLDKKTVEVDGCKVDFTKTEYEILLLLLEHRGQVFSRQQLIDRIWPSDVMVLDRTVDVNITRIRKKIAPYSHIIATRQGYGYYLDA
ncbi:MAG: response regulator transcription factor [Bacteroidaceae bacterium]|nr:response regulator transcription factor [Bacteroidaceae bacterium]